MLFSMDKNIDISVVIPLFNEEKNISVIYSQISEAFKSRSRKFEVIFVNDGSTDKSREVLAELNRTHPGVTVLSLLKNRGKAAALEVGVVQAKGKYVAVIDCDLQYDPKDLNRMMDELDNGFDFVSGRRMTREDSKNMVVTSAVFNVLIRRLTGLQFVDYFSGLKCFRREVIDYLSLYGDLYRFAAVYAYKQGFKVKEIPIVHNRRQFGESRYTSFRRLALAFTDVLTVLMTVTFNNDRVYYLGLAGMVALGVGLAILFIIWISSGFVLPIYLDSGWGVAGVFLLFFGLETAVLKKVSSDFFAKHQNEFIKRKKNLREILPPS